MIMRRLFFLLVVMSIIITTYAQDTLDSIAKVHIVVQDDELELFLYVGEDGDYIWSEKLQKLADSGSSAAQNAIGFCFQYGRGCEKNLDKALSYFELAAEQGNHKALNNLGNCYEHGIIVQQDYKQAYMFYKKAALLGHEIAMNNLAQCYMRGNGTEVDYYKARAWFEKTANSRGDRVAIVNTGFLYYQIGDNYDKAFKYLSKGAEMGSPGATEWLAMCYGYGKGCKQDIPKAIKLLNKVLTMSERIKDPDEYEFIKEKIIEFQKMR